jgi:adenylate cyclase, class 2
MDLLEIEIKSYCDDHSAVIRRLLDRGARKKGTSLERDLYLNHPARDFKSTDEALRLRQSGGRVIMTYKGPKLGTLAKTRVEKEVTMDGFDQALAILQLLGFTPSGTVVKSREMYELNGVEICIDSVEGLGNFVELEMKGTDREPVERELIRLAGELGLTRLERRSYLELLLGSG